jgi:hypothetical protein
LFQGSSKIYYQYSTNSDGKPVLTFTDSNGKQYISNNPMFEMAYNDFLDNVKHSPGVYSVDVSSSTKIFWSPGEADYFYFTTGIPDPTKFSGAHMAMSVPTPSVEKIFPPAIQKSLRDYLTSGTTFTDNKGATLPDSLINNKDLWNAVDNALAQMERGFNKGLPEHKSMFDLRAGFQEIPFSIQDYKMMVKGKPFKLNFSIEKGKLTGIQVEEIQLPSIPDAPSDPEQFQLHQMLFHQEQPDSLSVINNIVKVSS